MPQKGKSLLWEVCDDVYTLLFFHVLTLRVAVP